jgi:hypothetical protein
VARSRPSCSGPRAAVRDLLTQRLGIDRSAADPDAIDEMIVRCAHLPLALAVAAARACID